MLKYRDAPSVTLKSAMESNGELTIPARLVDVFLQSCLHLVVRQKGHVARVSHRQEVPVPQNRSPGLDRERKRKGKQRDGGVGLSRVCRFTQCWNLMPSDGVVQGHAGRTKLEPYSFGISEPFISGNGANSNDRSAPQTPQTELA